jgi:RHS repeat-associated protein
MSPTAGSKRWLVSSTRQPYGHCDIGHQGLLHDDEFDLIYNRARYLDPETGRYLQRDNLAHYADGASLYGYAKRNVSVR